VKHASFLRHPPSVTQFSRVLRNSPALEVLYLYPSSLCMNVERAHDDGTRASPSRHTTSLSTCISSSATRASRSCAVSHSRSTRAQNRPTPVRSQRSSSARQHYNTSHGNTSSPDLYPPKLFPPFALYRSTYRTAPAPRDADYCVVLSTSPRSVPFASRRIR
jgi:hypothetical protein